MTWPGMQLIVRPANSAESPRLTEIAREAKASWGYPVAWLEAWRDELSITPTYIESHTVLVAQSAESPYAVVGVCALEDHGDHWQLAHLWIDPHAQGRGAGRALIREALAIAGSRRPGSVVRVESDPHAAGFYRAMGAREIGARPAPMDGDPARTLPIFEFDTGKPPGEWIAPFRDGASARTRVGDTRGTLRHVLRGREGVRTCSSPLELACAHDAA